MVFAAGPMLLPGISLYARDDYGSMTPAGEVEVLEDVPSAGNTGRTNQVKRRFSLAQGGDVVPPEPKITNADEQGAAKTTPDDAASGSASNDEGASDTWESYSDKPEELAADDITRRIRVEDIIEPPSEYHFAAFGKDDPFVPPMLAQEVNAIELPIISPLQRHPLSSMGLTGVWGGGDGQRKALITVPDFGRGILGVVVKVGDPIGNSGGKVVAINKDGMTVREFHLAPDGSRIYEDRFLMLGDKPPIPLVSGNVVFRPGDDTGIVVDPIDRNAARGVVVDPQGPVLDRLWQTEPIRSLKQDPAARKAANTAPPTAQGPLPGAAVTGAGPQAAVQGQVASPGLVAQPLIPAEAQPGAAVAQPMQVTQPPAAPGAPLQPSQPMQPSQPAPTIPGGAVGGQPAAPAPAQVPPAVPTDS